MTSIAIARFIGLLFLSTLLVMSAVLLAYRLSPLHSPRRRIMWLLIWGFQGLALPIVIWALMNYGVSWELQPFMPDIQAARNAGDPWFPFYLRFLGRGIFIVASDWAAITLGWVVAQA